MVLLVVEEEQMGKDVGLGPLDTGLEVGKVGHADVLGPPLESKAIVVVEVFYSFLKVLERCSIGTFGKTCLDRDQCRLGPRKIWY